MSEKEVGNELTLKLEALGVFDLIQGIGLMDNSLKLEDLPSNLYFGDNIFSPSNILDYIVDNNTPSEFNSLSPIYSGEHKACSTKIPATV